MDEYSGQSGQEEHAEIDEDTRVLGAALESFRYVFSRLRLPEFYTSAFVACVRSRVFKI